MAGVAGWDMLVVFDVGGTLAQPESGGFSLTRRLVQASPLPSEEVVEVCRAVLNTAPEITPHLCDTVAARLQIDPHILTEYESPPLELCDGALEVVDSLARLGVRMVALSNVSRFDSTQVRWFRTVMGPRLHGVHASYEIGAAKPSPAVFHWLATRYRVATKKMTVVGDRWDIDIAGARAVGARAVWLSPQPLPHYNAPLPDEVRTAATLRDARPMLRNWAICGSRAPQPRDHPLRAVVVATNEHGDVLIVHAPEDGHQNEPTWHLPGGGVRPGDQPEDAAEREVAEELGVVVRCDAARAVWRVLPPDGDRRASVVVAFPVHCDSSTEPRRRDSELDRHRWVSPERAASLLFAGPAGDATVLAAVLGSSVIGR
ncbi:NUDIX domain-containing protein [Saccharopolyspora sp. K220]|uniref:NUDIX domain-containing protein n=1 Tax=Saccharopolyspora soli TaxID=2926618 RepID=UPI001F59A2D9|nr:NUDIX domain-containing protein [Saccharopolyspora soli]MCI2422890.1 NUDIX domain-containing protein [Saccharopolyspora soli]